MYHVILRHDAQFFFLAYGEDVDEELDQAMKHRLSVVGFCKNPALLTPGRLLVPAFGVMN
jgi:hypothetical protein